MGKANTEQTGESMFQKESGWYSREVNLQSLLCPALLSVTGATLPVLLPLPFASLIGSANGRHREELRSSREENSMYCFLPALPGLSSNSCISSGFPAPNRGSLTWWSWLPLHTMVSGMLRVAKVLLLHRKYSNFLLSFISCLTGPY